MLKRPGLASVMIELGAQIHTRHEGHASPVPAVNVVHSTAESKSALVLTAHHLSLSGTLLQVDVPLGMSFQHSRSTLQRDGVSMGSILNNSRIEEMSTSQIGGSKHP